jgi:hypothetical protein
MPKSFWSCHSNDKFSINYIYIGDVQHDIKCDNASDIVPYLLTLANRNAPISVAQPKVAKVSTRVLLLLALSLGLSPANIANVNEPKVVFKLWRKLL